MLEVSVPKPEQVKPHKVAITTSSTAPAIAPADETARASESADAPQSTELAAA